MLEEPPSWLAPRDRRRLRGAGNQLARIVEGLDALREHGTVLQEAFHQALAERTSRTTYLLTVVAAVFLPLNLIAGMLGANVAGIPGSDHSWGFAVVRLAMVVIAVLEIAVLRALRWL